MTMSPNRFPAELCPSSGGVAPLRPSLVGEVVEVGPLKLYPANQIVEREGDVINLGPKEFKILALLMERPGQVFSRVQPLDHVGHGVYIDDRTVDVHLSRLRKALNDKGEGEPLVRTSSAPYGSGYALITINNIYVIYL